RLVTVVPFARHWVVTHRDYVDLVRKELPEVPAAHVIGEPRGLNTGPAVALAAAAMREEDPNALMLVQAADHWIRDVRRFRALVRFAFTEVERRGPAPRLSGFARSGPPPASGTFRLAARRRR